MKIILPMQINWYDKGEKKKRHKSVEVLTQQTNKQTNKVMVMMMMMMSVTRTQPKIPCKETTRSLLPCALNASHLPLFVARNAS